MSEDPKAIRVGCPYCEQTVELPLADAKRGLNCPSCFKFFMPLEDRGKPAPAGTVNRYHRPIFCRRRRKETLIKTG